MLLALLAASCTDTTPVELVFRLLDPAPADVVFELRVYDDPAVSCASVPGGSVTPIRAGSGDGDDFDAVTPLPEGRYVFHVLARRPSDCEPVLRGCRAVDLGETTRVEVELSAVTASGPACATGACDGAGRCVPGPRMDGGVEAGAPDADTGAPEPSDSGVDAGSSCGDVRDCPTGDFYECASMTCEPCGSRLAATEVDLMPEASELRRGVSIVSDGARVYVAAAFETRSERRAAVATFGLSSLEDPSMHTRQDLATVWSELTEPESLSLAWDGTTVSLIANNLRDPVEMSGSPPLVLFAHRNGDMFESVNTFPHGPDLSPVLGRMISVGGERVGGGDTRHPVRHVWRLRQQTDDTLVAAADTDSGDYRDTLSDDAVDVGEEDYVEMVASGGRWAVFPDDAAADQARFFDAWRGTGEAATQSTTTAPTPGVAGRYGFAYLGGDDYALVYPRAGGLVELWRVRCSRTVPCVLPDATAVDTIEYGNPVGELAAHRLGDGLALAWVDRNAASVSVSVFGADLGYRFEVPMLSVDSSLAAITDARLEVVESAAGTVILVAAGIDGSGELDDRVEVAGFRLPPGCGFP